MDIHLKWNWRNNLPFAKLESMKVITIPRTLSRKGDLVLIPRREYEKLLQLRKIREFQPTAKHKGALRRAERNLGKGRALSYDAVARALGIQSEPRASASGPIALPCASVGMTAPSRSRL
jgi:hypothetical protein